MLVALLPDFDEWSFRMISMKKALSAIAFAALMATGALLATAGTASAYMACNREGGDCWHTEAKVRAPGAHFDYHPDDWYFHQKWDGGDRHYRDYHEGRGYYKGGVWITL
jgi:hypothetical protein